MRGQEQKLTLKQGALLAALMTEPSHAAAASKAGVSEATLYRWLQLPAFQKAYRQARRQLVEAAVGRMQAAAGKAVDTLLAVTQEGPKDSDRVRAAVALLEHAVRGVTHADALHTEPASVDVLPVEGTAGVVQTLTRKLQELEAADLPTAEKARLTATLADALLRAIGVDVLDKRLEALQTVLLERKEKKP